MIFIVKRFDKFPLSSLIINITISNFLLIGSFILIKTGLFYVVFLLIFSIEIIISILIIINFKKSSKSADDNIINVVKNITGSYETDYLQAFKNITSNSVEINKKNINIFNDISKHSLNISTTIKDSVYFTTLITGSIKIIKEASDNLNSSIIQSSASINQISQTVSEFVKQIDQQASAVSATSTAIEEMNASISNVNIKTDSKKNLSLEILKDAEYGEEKQIAIKNDIDNITKKIDSILEIIQIIDNVAAQTNLLAINAAIEASHAGEFGKGFSIVSNEIRKLAESTAQNSKSINTNINDVIEKIKKISNTGNENLLFYQKIKTDIQNMVDFFDEVTGMSKELKTASSEILSAIFLLIQISENIKTGFSEMHSSINEINQAIHFIQDESIKNKEQIEEISETTSDINEIFKNITEQKISEGILFDDIRNSIHNRNDGNLNLPVIILQHILWVLKVRLVLDGKLRIDLNEIGDHTKCDLGKWMLSSKSETFRSHKQFREFESKHEKLHHYVFDILANEKKMNQKELENKFNSMIEISRNIVVLLIEIFK